MTAFQRTSADRVLLLGGISHANYFWNAVEVRSGDRLNPYEVAENHVWNLERRELERPDDWLARLAA